MCTPISFKCNVSIRCLKCYLSLQLIRLRLCLGMCLEVSNGGIHYKNCSNFLTGCPETNFKSTEFYKCKVFLSLSDACASVCAFFGVFFMLYVYIIINIIILFL